MHRSVLLLVAIWAIQLANVQSAEPKQLTPEEAADGWLLLFDGTTTFGWQPQSKANWKVADGIISVSEGDAGLLTTTSEFADYVLKVDFRYAAGTNSGIFLRTAQVAKDPAADCYELNIADDKVSPFPTGSFVKRQKGEYLGDTREWQSYEITAEGPHFTIKLNDKLVLDYVDPEPLGRGRIGLQFNSGLVEFRNVKLKPLGLQSLFNGKDLTGWHVAPDKPSVFWVTPAGELHVENGNGQLESDGQFADFTLQLDIFSNGKALNSGVFFRCIPGEFWQGYECQIQNGYVDGDRNKPADCGTGGFYRRQNARRVVADDFAWFRQTLIVSGNHMAAWVNGYQVSDWTDERKPDVNPRKGSRLAAGTLAIQGHDKTTNLSFRKLQAAEMPGR